MKKKENEKDVNTLLIIRREKKKQALNERNLFVFAVKRERL